MSETMDGVMPGNSPVRGSMTVSRVCSTPCYGGEQMSETMNGGIVPGN